MQLFCKYTLRADANGADMGKILWGISWLKWKLLLGNGFCSFLVKMKISILEEGDSILEEE